MLTGKGMYVHKIKNVEGGNFSSAAEIAKSAGINYVMVKILDGVGRYNQRETGKQNGLPVFVDDWLPVFVKAFRDQGISVWGWQWLYFDNPVNEARAAITRVNLLGLDGFIANGEGYVKNKPAETNLYLSTLRDDFLTVPLAFSSYRYPSLHQEVLWASWLRECDIMMPQVYWMGQQNSAEQLSRSLNEYTALILRHKVDNPPEYVPTGSAFSEFGWTPTPQSIGEFVDRARSSDIQSVNFWEWNHARNTPGLWHAVEEACIGQPQPPDTTTVTLEEFVANHVYPFIKGLGYNGPAPKVET